MANEDNFFDKARRMLLRTFGVGSSKDGLAASVGPDGQMIPPTPAEIEAKQKIKQQEDPFGTLHSI